MLEVRRVMRRECIFRDRTNPLEIYDDLELFERFRCNETSVFALAHILSHFFCISLTSFFTEFPALIIFAISCHALFLFAEVIDEENFAFKIAFLFSHSSNNKTVSLSVQFGFLLDIVYFQQSRIVIFKHTRP